MLLTQENKIFEPTWLYIKRHTETGLMYLGQTKKKNVLKYNGSGRRWLPHIRKHGIHKVETLWFCLFTDLNELTKTALSLSNNMNIVESSLWANLKPENGVDGAIKGIPLTEEHKNKLKEAKKNRNHEQKMSEDLWKCILLLGTKRTEKQKTKMSAAQKNKSTAYITEHFKTKMSDSIKKVPNITCPHCKKETTPGNATRWHFSNCKLIR